MVNLRNAHGMAFKGKKTCWKSLQEMTFLGTKYHTHPEKKRPITYKGREKRVRSEFASARHIFEMKENLSTKNSIFSKNFLEGKIKTFFQRNKSQNSFPSNYKKC